MFPVNSFGEVVKLGRGSYFHKETWTRIRTRDPYVNRGYESITPRRAGRPVASSEIPNSITAIFLNYQLIVCLFSIIKSNFQHFVRHLEFSKSDYEFVISDLKNPLGFVVIVLPWQIFLAFRIFSSPFCIYHLEFSTSVF